jgi:Cu+-exporting ATPase
LQLIWTTRRRNDYSGHKSYPDGHKSERRCGRERSFEDATSHIYNASEETMAIVKDVVCGMMVDPDIAHHKSKHRDKAYYFCSPGCKAAFDDEPEKYVSREESGSSS